MGKNPFLLRPPFLSGSCRKDEKWSSGHLMVSAGTVAPSLVNRTLVMMAVLAVALYSHAVEIVDRVVAVVNDDVVSLYELNQLVKPFVEKIRSSQYPEDVERQLTFEVRQKVLQQLIDQKLTDQQLERLQISVSENEVDESIERLKESRFFTDENLRAALEKDGLTYEDYRQQVKKQLLRVKLVNREVRSKIVITDEDIKAYYESHPSDYAGEKKYLLHNIYTRLPAVASDQDRQLALGLMEAILQELENGKPFAALTVEYTGVTAMVESSKLGYFKLDELSEQLQKAVGSMQAGTYTPILESDFGYQIVYLETIDEIGGKSLEEVSAEIYQKLYEEIVDQKYETWLQVLRERSHIKIIN